MQENAVIYIEKKEKEKENEIYLRELFRTLMKWKKFIIMFTSLVTLSTVIYVLMKTPIYEVKAVISIGSINNNNSVIENTNNLVKKLELLYIDSAKKGQETLLSSVSIVKKTTNLVELKSTSISNEKASALLNEIVLKIIHEHQAKIDNYTNLVKEQIARLVKQKEELEIEKNKFDGSMALKFDLSNKIDTLSLSISSYNIQQTSMIGEIIRNDYPIKPKKKLIAVVAFVTGLILSMFLVFFLEFIREEDELKSGNTK